MVYNGEYAISNTSHKQKRYTEENKWDLLKATDNLNLEKKQ